MQANYGTLAGNARVNSRIHECLEMLFEEDARKFVKKFRHDPSDQSAHTFRELLVGAYLVGQRLKARYDKQVLGKTPDWSSLDNSDTVVGVIEQMTFHQTRTIEIDIENALRAGTSWTGWLPSNVDRLFQKLHEKAERYDAIATTLQVPYVVAIFGDGAASVDRDELDEVLFKAHNGGAFSQFTVLSGVLFFEESAGQYTFTYIENPDAFRTMKLGNAVL